MTERTPEDYNLAAHTYHTRFIRLCKELTETIIAWDKFRIGWQGRIPPEFLVDESPMLSKFLSLYEEFRECMTSIGENQRDLAIMTREHMDNQQQQINTLKSLNEVNETIIKHLEN